MFLDKELEYPLHMSLNLMLVSPTTVDNIVDNSLPSRSGKAKLPISNIGNKVLRQIIRSD